MVSNENQFAKVELHLGKSYLKVGVVASRSYAAQRQNPSKSVKISCYMEKETWKSRFQETRTSGTYRYQIPNIHKTVKFLSLLSQKDKI